MCGTVSRSSGRGPGSRPALVARSRPLWAIVLLALVALLLSVTARAHAGDCPGDDLLQPARAIDSRGVSDPTLLTDGWMVPDGVAFNAPEAAQLRGLRPFVTWDLGRTATLRAATAQVDNNDTYRLSTSIDGKTFEPWWVSPPLRGSGLTERAAQPEPRSARFVRFEAVRGDGLYAATEVRVYCQTPPTWPPPRHTKITLPENPEQILTYQLYSWKVVLGLTGLALLLVVVPRLRHRKVALLISWTLVALSVLAWTQFGQLHPGRKIVHTPDTFHYFMGPKYFEELGYFELYRCTARAERELGRGALFNDWYVRDLDDNRVYRGFWFSTPEGRCRATFSPDRWERFKRDVDAYEAMMADQHPLHRSLSDHGFNATPFHTAWLKLWVAPLPAGPLNLALLTLLDVVALIVAIGVMSWAFGARTAALFALLFALGFHFAYHWVGGCLGRHTWFMWACAGLALLARRRPFWGAAALTLAGLHRFFPFVFVAALGLAALIECARHRRVTAQARRILLGILLTTTLGVGVAGLTNGWQSFPAFATVMQRHAGTPGGNRMGLPVLLGFSPGRTSTQLADARLSDPHQVWKTQIRTAKEERRPLWLFALALCLGLIGWAAYRGAKPWEVVTLAGPLVFSAQDMTSYDYIWILLLVPLCASSVRRTLWLAGYCLLTTLLGIFLLDVELQHLFFTLALPIALTGIVVDFVRELSARARNPASPTVTRPSDHPASARAALPDTTHP